MSDFTRIPTRGKLYPMATQQVIAVRAKKKRYFQVDVPDSLDLKLSGVDPAEYKDMIYISHLEISSLPRHIRVVIECKTDEIASEFSRIAGYTNQIEG